MDKHEDEREWEGGQEGGLSVSLLLHSRGGRRESIEKEEENGGEEEDTGGD